jgi:hypothetical protein
MAMSGIRCEIASLTQRSCARVQNAVWQDFLPICHSRHCHASGRPVRLEDMNLHQLRSPVAAVSSAVGGSVACVADHDPGLTLYLSAASI